MSENAIAINSSTVQALAFTVNGKSVTYSVTKTGFKIPGQKELGQLVGLKGAALKRAHFALRLEAGKKLNEVLSAEMAGGRLIGRAVATTAGGEVKVTFTRTADLTEPPAGRGPSKAAAERATKEKMAARLVEAGKFASIEEAMAFLA